MPQYPTPYDPTALASSMAAIDPTGGQVPQLPSPPSQEEEENDRFQAMLAPYKAQAQKLYGGNPVFGNSPFAQHHPDLASHLSNMLLAAAAYKPGQTTGENIASAARMAIAPEQVARQREIAQNMYPYQMLGPQIEMQNNLTMQRQRQAQMMEEQQRGNWYDNQIAKGQQERTQGPTRYDNKGNIWQQTFNPMTGTTRLYNPVTRQFADTLPTNEQPSFTNELKQRNQASEPEVERMLDRENQWLVSTGHPPMNPNQENDFINQTLKTQAGNRAAADTGSSQSAPHFFTKQQAFLKMQYANRYNSLTPPAKSLMDYMMANPKGTYSQNIKAYQKTVDDYKAGKLKIDKEFPAFSQSSDAQSFKEFDPNKDYSQPINQPVDNTYTPNWRPK